MLTPKEFTTKIAQDCEPMYQHQEQSVKNYFAANPSKEEMIGYFSRRMVNERINCVQLSKRVIALSPNSDVEEMFLLSKQAHDEAKHFWFLKDIVEDLLGHEVDVDAVLENLRHKQLNDDENETMRPAELLEKFECSDDPLALAVYQYVAEGMAHRNWVMQAECAPNDLIRTKYAEIAKDEKFHASIGRNALEKLVIDQETQDRAAALVNEFVDLLWDLGCIKQHIPKSEMH
jgi:rubrerythrin